MTVLLAILGASTLAIAIPIFSTLAAGPAFFVAHNSSAADLLQFALLVFFGPALLLWLGYLLAALMGKTAARAFLIVVIALLIGVWVAGNVPSAAGWAYALVFVAVIVSAIIFWRAPEALNKTLSYGRWLGLVSLLAPLAFLLFSPVSALLQTESVSPATTTANAKTNIHPVVVLVLDELPLDTLTNGAGDIDAGRLPNFARLAALSTRYSNITSVSGLTDKAVPALLSGQKVTDTKAPIHQQFPDNLFTLLAASHSMHVSETGTRLCPPSVCAKQAVQETPPGKPTRDSKHSLTAADSGADYGLYRDTLIVFLHSILPAKMAVEWLPDIQGQWHGFGETHSSRQPTENSEPDNLSAFIADMQRDQSKRMRRFAASLAELEQDSLHYLHLALPHTPWIYLPDGRRYNGEQLPGREPASYSWQSEQVLVEQGMLRYALQLEYLDKLLGGVLDSLQSSANFDPAMLVVVADHGLAFSAGQSFRNATADSLAAIARVPLFIKYPGQREAVNDNSAGQTIDVLPTILNSLGIAAPATIQGQALGPDVRAETRQRSIAELATSAPGFEEMLSNSSNAAFHTVVTPGQSAQQSLAQGAGKQFMGAELAALSEFKRNSTVDVTAQLSRPELFRDIDLAKGFLPVVLSAKLSSQAITEQASAAAENSATAEHSAADYLVALNGRIAGSAKSYAHGEQLSLLLNPEGFIQGKNDIQLLQLRGSELRPVALTQALLPFSLEWSSDGELVGVSLDKRRWKAQTAKALRGEMQRSAQNAIVASIGGWALSSDGQQAAEHLLLLRQKAPVSSSFRRYLTINGQSAAANGQSAAALPGESKSAAGIESGYSIDLGGGAAVSEYTVLALFEDDTFLHLTKSK